MNLNELAKAREWLACLKLRSDISLGEDGFRNIDTTIGALDLLLNAGEVLPPKVRLDEKFEPQCYSYSMGYNTRADEDTAILARKMMGLEEVIRRVPLFEDGIGQDEGCNVGVEINEESVNELAQAIAQHPKGEGK